MTKSVAKFQTSSGQILIYTGISITIIYYIYIYDIFNVNFSFLTWRHLPYIRPIKGLYKGISKIWPYMVQYLHFRNLNVPLNILCIYIYDTYSIVYSIYICILIYTHRNMHV